MMWHYFPIGFRFPVGDFSNETKRHCWEITLSALNAAGGAGATLFDTEQPYDYGTDGPVYLCIACFENIKQSRAVGKALYAQNALMTELALHRPFLQANALESFGPYVQHGTLTEDGTVRRTETEFAFFPSSIPNPRNTGNTRHLIAAEPYGDAITAETVTRLLGKAANDRSESVQRILLSDGGIGTVRALVTAKNGRYEPVTFRDALGERHTETIGILPGFQAVLDPSVYRTDVLNAALSYGYRHFLTGKGTEPDDLKQVLADYADPCTVETIDPHAVLETVGLETAAENADKITLFLSGSGLQPETVLPYLHGFRKPTLLLTMDADANPDLLKQAFPCLSDVIVCPKSLDALEQTLIGVRK